jgi:Holliday junction resolvasome RuvABC endonuclease subunit
MTIKNFDGGLDLAGSSPVSVYVGIDQSYSGFAITLLGEDNAFFTQVFKSDLRGIDRLVEIRAFLSNVLFDTPIKILDVAMEDYAYAGSGRVFHLGELGGMVKLECHASGHYPLLVPPTSLKKYVTGKGTGIQKNQMLLHIYKKWGVEFTDDNAADSYSLARVVSGKHELAYEKDVYDKLQDVKHRER